MILYINSENYLKNQYTDIIEDLAEQEKRENKKIEIILDFLDKFNDYLEIDNNDNNIQSYIIMLEKLKNLSDNLRANKVNLNNLKTILNNLFSENFDINNDIQNKIDEYNNLAVDCKKNIRKTSDQFEDFITEYIKNMAFSDDSKKQTTTSLVKNTNNVINENQQKQENTYEEDTQEIKDNRVLLISETQKKVFLPYYKEDLEKRMKNYPKYQNLQQVINSEYIISLSKYKNPIISRFKESYNLMRIKESASISDSISLALELAFNSQLNPAIISACKTLDELDIYLDCLNSNELDKFTIFDIKYEVLPTNKY